MKYKIIYILLLLLPLYSAIGQDFGKIDSRFIGTASNCICTPSDSFYVAMKLVKGCFTPPNSPTTYCIGNGYSYKVFKYAFSEDNDGYNTLIEQQTNVSTYAYYLTKKYGSGSYMFELKTVQGDYLKEYFWIGDSTESFYGKYTFNYEYATPQTNIPNKPFTPNATQTVGVKTSYTNYEDDNSNGITSYYRFKLFRGQFDTIALGTVQMYLSDSTLRFPNIYLNPTDTELWIGEYILGSYAGNEQLCRNGWAERLPRKKIALTFSSPTAPTIILTGTLSSFSTIVGTPTTPQSITVSGSALTSNLIVTSPTEYQVSIDNITYTSNISLVPTSGTVTNTTIYVRYNPSSSGTHTGNISITSAGATTHNLPVSGTCTDPVVNNPSIIKNGMLSSFSSEVGTYSTTQTFTVSGTYLTNNIVLTAPINFQISIGNGFSSSISLIPVSGTVSTTIVTVRYLPTSAITNSGNITITSSGASTLNVVVSGTGTPPTSTNPTLSYTQNLQLFTSNVSQWSMAQSFTISGSNLTGNVVITASSFFNISLASNFTTQNQTLNLTPLNGVVNTTIFIKAYSYMPNHSYSGAILLSTQGVNDDYFTVYGETSDITTGIIHTDNVGLKIYPNPTSDYLTSVRELGNYEIVDIIGNQVLTGTAEYQIEVSMLQTGYYVLRTESLTHKFYKK